MANKDWVDGQAEAYPGWASIIRYVDKQLGDIDPDYKVNQIKEKFGGLRYYFLSDSDGFELMNEIVTVAEKESFRTCENCGTKENVATKADNSWIKTLCKKCRSERK